MARDWIKLRPALVDHPSFLSLAQISIESRAETLGRITVIAFAMRLQKRARFDISALDSLLGWRHMNDYASYLVQVGWAKRDRRSKAHVFIRLPTELVDTYKSAQSGGLARARAARRDKNQR